MYIDPDEDAMVALLRNDRDDGWLRYENPTEIVCADTLEQVLPALERVEQYTERGLTAVGYLSYEAAPAFDNALHCYAGDAPLLLFGLFESGSAYTLPPAEEMALRLSPSIGKPAYRRRFDLIRKRLASGDCYQVNLTHPLRGYLESGAEELFAALYQAQPSSLSVFLRWGQLAVCSVSPELFIERRGEQLRMQPMKGTRPRSPDPVRDRALRSELQQSEKERAENLMIVDMVRNDLGRIAEPGSIRVDGLFDIVALPSAWQQVSTVAARSRVGLTALFAATFPCASITGAPKARAMHIIRELEAEPRGLYTGAIGRIRGGGDLRFSVAIRSAVLNLRDGFASYGVGGGIVWDSEAASEWLETEVKADIVNGGEHGFELLETMAFRPGEGVARIERHLSRLGRSADYFGFDFDSEALRETLSQFSGPEASRLRLLLKESGDFELQSLPLAGTRAPVRLRLATRPVDCRDPFLRHKTTRRRVYELMRQDLEEADDVLLFNQFGGLTETSIFNLYLEVDGRLLTPPCDQGLLGGVYREMLLEQGRAEEAPLTLDDLPRAERLWVSNSVRGLQEAVLLPGN